MAKERSEQSRFLSNFSDGQSYITAAQYVIECLCVLIAKREKKELKPYFWKDKYWAKVFRNQITAANKLLKEYPVEVILASIKDKRCWKLSSLRAQHILSPILEEKYKEYKIKESNLNTLE